MLSLYIVSLFLQINKLFSKVPNGKQKNPFSDEVDDFA